MEKIKIYVLVDPITLKVRYIGRTKCTLEKRLREHICKAKNNYSITHKNNWIKSLIEQDLKPIIRKLTEIEGWTESHIFEKSLICKYKERLVNSDDRGEGCKDKIVTSDQKNKISETLKLYYSNNRGTSCKEIYVYNYEGEYLFSCYSVKRVSEILHIRYGMIMRHLGHKVKRKHCKTFQFSYIKHEQMLNLNTYNNKDF